VSKPNQSSPPDVENVIGKRACEFNMTRETLGYELKGWLGDKKMYFLCDGYLNIYKCSVVFLNVWVCPIWTLSQGIHR